VVLAVGARSSGGEGLAGRDVEAEEEKGRFASCVVWLRLGLGPAAAALATHAVESQRRGAAGGRGGLLEARKGKGGAGSGAREPDRLED
jgi:hypothetical protein